MARIFKSINWTGKNPAKAGGFTVNKRRFWAQFTDAEQNTFNREICRLSAYYIIITATNQFAYYRLTTKKAIHKKQKADDGKLLERRAQPDGEYHFHSILPNTEPAILEFIKAELSRYATLPAHLLKLKAASQQVLIDAFKELATLNNGEEPKLFRGNKPAFKRRE